MSAAQWHLQGKRCLVTGASKGLGLAIADEMASLGAQILIVARNQNDLEAARQAILDKTPAASVLLRAADVSTAQGRDYLLQEVKQIWGLLDCLVNNVGTNRRKPIEDTDEVDYELMLRTNQDSCFFMCQKFFSLLRSSSSASVVNVSSVAGVRSTGTGVVYAMTKAAMAHMSEALACEWAPYNIRVNCVAPWMTMTPLLKEAIDKDPSQIDPVLTATPMGRLGHPADTAGAVCFLCMQAAAFITGQIISVDGGISAQGYRGPCIANRA